jgi:uncharacterized protein (TIGR03435 family)
MHQRSLRATAGTAVGVTLLLVGALYAPWLHAQSPLASSSGGPAFEVASIKPNKTDAPSIVGMGFAPDGIRARNVPPSTMLWMALGVQPDQIVEVPPWATTDRFDIIAKVAPGEVFNTKMFSPMLLHLLADRFQLKMHHETRELNVYRLVRLRADRLGPKIAPAPIDACQAAQTDAAAGRTPTRGCSAGPVPGGIGVHGMSIGTLANLMESSAGRVIVDATELTGNWDLDLAFVNPTQSADGDGPSLFTALQEQLGLKLEPGRAPVDVVVVDHLERPTPD